MRTLAIDIETYSSADLKTTGVYKYVEAPDFAILLFAYAYNNGPVTVIDVAKGEDLPDEVLNDLTSMFVLKTAFNANFERTCIREHFKLVLPPGQWECTMVKASMLGLPLSLEFVAKVLKLEEEKLEIGKNLIRYFSLPCKPTKTNAERLRNLPEHDPEKWQKFKDYCAQDVVVEQAIRTKIDHFTIPDMEKALWRLDQRINDGGVLLDPKFVRKAIILDKTHRDLLTEEAVKLTGLDNPNSVSQLKTWLADELLENVADLKKDSIPALLKQADSTIVKRVLRIRQELSKTSIKKYMAMHKAICKDNRARGLLQYYGANRTGRWAGRQVQVQNLPKNHLTDLDLARQLVRAGDLEMLNMLFDNVPDTLSQLIRTAFIAPPGHRFIVADFSAIEARVIAWLAGERWRLDVFNTHGRIYEASAAHMFKVPIEVVTKGSDFRQRGKVAELALGYQGGPGALIKMGALEMGLQEEELPKLVAMWRNANRMIVKYWETVEEAAIYAMEEGATTISHHIMFSVDRRNDIFKITLPSGRNLCYLHPRLKPNKFGGTSLTYEGMDQTTKKWCRQDTYGGKLVENIVQAIARDCLADAMLRLDKAGYNIVMHVHDEAVMQMPDGKGSIEEVNRIMGQPIPWAVGLPLKAESSELLYYKKD